MQVLILAFIVIKYGGKNTKAGENMIGISLVSSSAAANTILYNNVISDLVATNNGGSFGVYAFSGGGYKIYNNTVNLNTSNGETGVSSAFIVNGINITAANALDVRNNIFANNKSSGLPLAIYSSGNSNAIFSNIDYNDYYSAGANLGYISGGSSTTLEELKAGFGGNVNSLNLSPVFVGANDLHLKTDSNQGLDNKGVSLPEVLTDFDGIARGATPDMGAYEFTSTILAVTDVNKANVSVYPNPFKDVLKISDVKDARSIIVADASGRVVATPKVSQELNLSNLSKGVYFVTVGYESGSSKSFKVIKD